MLSLPSTVQEQEAELTNCAGHGNQLLLNSSSCMFAY